MKRLVVLATVLTVGALSLAVAASQQPAAAAQAARVVEVEKLRDNLFVLTGGGGNTAVFVGASGVVVVDTKNPGWGQPILDRIKELSPKPVTTIINTHTHGDHVSGNVEFPATVDVVVQENTATNMKAMKAVTGLSKPGAPPPVNIFEQNQGKGLPKRTFKDRMTLFKGPDQVELYCFGRGHTNGDAWRLFPSARVVTASDIVPGKRVPIVDSNDGGSGVEYGDSVSKAHGALSKVADTFVTGHAMTFTTAELMEYATFIREFAEAARAAEKAGTTVEAFAKSYTIPAKFQGYTPTLEAAI